MSIFKNTEVAFKDKNKFDLYRAYLIFKIISNPILSKFLISILKISFKLHLPINWIIKNTVFKQFCGGENIRKSKKITKKLWASKIGSILDYSVEGKQNELDFNNCMNEIIKCIKYASKNDNIPFSVFKTTGITNFELLKKISSGKDLNELEKKQKYLLEKKFDKICYNAEKYNVPILVDAEESWIQDAIDEIVLIMQKKYNKHKPIVYNTLQMYRHDRIKYLNQILKDAKKEKFYIGLKIVRGAYHQKEINRAKEFNYICPVHTLKNKTDEDFNEALKICVKNYEIVSICAGTHNEESSAILSKLITNNNINNTIYFSQLLGMSDHISYNLSKNNYNVAKYVPYGPIREVIPYLIRRAEENISIEGQIGRELSNIILEIKRRY